MDKERWVYVWAASYSGLRAEHTKLCALVVIGVERGEKRFLSIEDGVRESTQSWREVLLKLKSRGMNVPELAIGDGAMGFWAVGGSVRWDTPATVLDAQDDERVTACPSRYRPKPRGVHAIWQAETKADAEQAFDLFLKV